MKRIIIAPDSFKGSLTACRVCSIVGGVLRREIPDCEVIELPIADGGEGTVDAYLHAFGGKRLSAPVKTPLFNETTAQYALLNDGTAVLEMAQASGLTLEKKNNAMRASTYGTGQLILSALDNGAEKIILGLGGSATTDGGSGCASALGAVFADEAGRPIPPGAGGLLFLRSIDLSGLDKRLAKTPITGLCDVENPLFGRNGAAYVYSPQKGASPAETERMDKGLRQLAAVVGKALGTDYSAQRGAGAAGGMGFCTKAILGGTLKSGIDSVLDAASFERLAGRADLVITGEGRLDEQSLMGKVIGGVVKRGKGTRTAAIVGRLDIPPEKVRQLGLSMVIETNPLHLPFEEVLPTAERDLELAAHELAQIINSGKNF